MHSVGDTADLETLADKVWLIYVKEFSDGDSRFWSVFFHNSSTNATGKQFIEISPHLPQLQ